MPTRPSRCSITPSLSLLSGRGRILGLERGSELVAYGVLQHDLKAEDDPCEVLGLSPGTSVVKLAGAAVGHDWRGAGLQRLPTSRAGRACWPVVLRCVRCCTGMAGIPAS